MDTPVKPSSRRALASRIAVMAASAFAGILAVFIMGSELALATREATSIAVVALVASLPLVDSVIFGSSVRPETAGATFGLSLGFFLRQSLISDALHKGADRILMTAFVVSLVLAGWRWSRRSHKA